MIQNLFRRVTPAVFLILLLMLLAGCDPTVPGQTDPDHPGLPVVEDPVDPLDPPLPRHRRIDRYLIYYGAVDASIYPILWRYELVILNPNNAAVTRAIVADIQNGADGVASADDVLVVAYVAIGEDLRTFGLSAAEMAADPLFAGDGTGPRVDPRGPLPDGGTLTDDYGIGTASPGGSGFASYYLDDLDRNGQPDFNPAWECAFINAGDPAWYAAVEAMRFETDGVYGLREILTADYGRGLECDGVFLDCLDTAAPNRYTDASSAVQSEFEWTAPGAAAFIARLDAAYPDHLIVQNRGLFYFDPDESQYPFAPVANIDFLLFESYRLDSSNAAPFNRDYFHNNKYHVLPKLMVESGRENGFQVLSLGYTEDENGCFEPVLHADGTSYTATLATEIAETQVLAGFRHYLTDRTITSLNTYVLDHAPRDDGAAPVWSSTYNPLAWNSAVAPEPRTGIQAMAPGEAAGTITVHWDVALSANPVVYELYLFSAMPDLTAEGWSESAVRYPLAPGRDAAYAQGTGPDRYPHVDSIAGLESNSVCYALIRARDTGPAARQEANTVLLSCTVP